MYEFTDRVDNVTDLLLESFESSLFLPTDNKDPNTVVLFSNGDKMTVNIMDRTFIWEPIHPGAFATSKLSLRLHSWFSKGYIQKIA